VGARGGGGGLREAEQAYPNVLDTVWMLEKNVLWLEVAMHNGQTVQMRHSVNHLPKNEAGIGLGVGSRLRDGRLFGFGQTR
jgi:hypothetical protein